MKTAYFDCFDGISGDMTLGALIDAGADEAALRAELAKLGLDFELVIGRSTRRGISGVSVEVRHHEHEHRHLPDIERIIGGSALSEGVKARALLIFRRLAEAEGRVHGVPAEHVHFHEVGAVDAIVDIVGVCICLELLGVERIASSPLPLGSGFVECAHGTIPIPAPATVELLSGVPVYAGGEGETVTPTGAAIIRCAEDFEMPQMTLSGVGYGAGARSLLRVMLGESKSLPEAVRVSMVETNIDDMNPELYPSVFEALFSAGALDVYATPISMKKGRPAVLLSAVCPPERADEVARTVLAQTSSFGVRVSAAERLCLPRERRIVTTSYGDVRVKIGPGKAAPEYEDCRAAAETHGVPVRLVYEEAAARAQFLKP
ncbi:MAG: nickel pincer cofactor biosynthesis protein LarC [Armatimonadota bacterium]